MVSKQTSHKEKTIIKWMRIISIASIIVSSYLLYLHYSNVESFCDISQSISCDIVNKSPYSEFPPGSGVPVSLMGILTFIIVLISIQQIKNNKHKKALSNLIFYLMTISLLFALYLVYTELFLILSICILCVGLDIFIILMLILSYRLRGIVHEKKHKA